MSINLERALVCARGFGGEAQANGRTVMTDDDREDIAHYYCAPWTDIPGEHRIKLMEAFKAGTVSEARLIKHLAHKGGILDNIDECEACNGA